MNKSKLSLIALAIVFSGCSATTQFEAVQSDVSMQINGNPAFSLDESPSKEYSTTSFGQYQFKASREGQEPMYGLVPLKFNGGYLAADILFFAPALFFNLREVYPHYQVDIEKNEIRYKRKSADAWTTHQPTAEEVARAKAHFEN